MAWFMAWVTQFGVTGYSDSDYVGDLDTQNRRLWWSENILWQIWVVRRRK